MQWSSCLVFTTIVISTTLALPSLLVTNSDYFPRLKRPEQGGNYAKHFRSAPQIYQMSVKANVNNRFSQTTVVNKIKNTATEAQEATFSIIFPKNAFISGFVMEVHGKNYTAYVKEKEEAKKTYEQAVNRGSAAAHVARNSNRFTISVNIEPTSNAVFYLNYEELLTRQNGHYELIINLHPGQPVQDLSVEALITENLKITKLKTKSIRSGKEIGTDNEDLDPRATFQIINTTAVIVKFSPNIDRQKQLTRLLGTKEEQGLAGQFVVQYDVERDPPEGEVLVGNGYFVYFFAPSELPPLPKHVVFVLDTSSSMRQKKIQQLRKAAFKMLDQLNDNDLFHLVEFNTNIRVWNLENNDRSVWYPFSNGNVWNNRKVNIEELVYPSAYSVSGTNIKMAKDAISKFGATGSANIYSALKVGLRLVEVTKEQYKSNHQPIIMFLTNGEPTIGITSTKRIVNEITEYNNGLRKTPIFPLSFGKDVDKMFLKKLALRNSGFSKHIYEASDTSLQLQGFYQQISSPLLANVSFNYESPVSEVTKTEFPLYFRGSEIVISGRIDFRPEADWGFNVNVDTWDERKTFKPIVKKSDASIERVWAYLTMTQLLNKRETFDDEKETLKKNVVDLALKYSFVTPMTSLVVVKPDTIDVVDTVTTDINDSPQWHEQYSNVRIPQNLERKINIFSVLPWLEQYVNQNGILNISQASYNLGLNETFAEDVTCPKTPLKTVGHCTLLHMCPQALPYLSNINALVAHICLLKIEFAGICCPDVL